MHKTRGSKREKRRESRERDDRGGGTERGDVGEKMKIERG